MPTLDLQSPDKFIKLLILGDSGSGKTGALASLVEAGYSLKIVDFDNGLPILAAKLRETNPKLLTQVDYETCTDKFQNLGGRPVAVTADAWRKGVTALERYHKSNLGDKDILVLDTMTLAAEAALRHVLKLENRINQPPQLQDWGAAMDLVQNLIAMMTSTDFACHVIINSHITHIGEGDSEKGYPATLGKKLSPKIGRYFNGMLLFRSMGSGASTQRVLLTNTYTNIELKNPNPAKVKAQYPIKSGLADYFAAVRG